MLLRRLLPFIFLFSGLFVCGNNLNLGSSVKIIDVTSSGVTFEISVSWSNSWSDGFNNDAAWVFFKYRTVSGNWSHLFLNGPTEVSEGYSFLPGSSGGDLTGLFLFRSAAGSGTSSSVCRLTWDYSGSGLTSDDFHQNKVLFMAQGIEMVFVPFGSFVLGDGVSSSSFVSASGTPVSVTGDGSEEPVELHTPGSSSSVSLSGTYPSGFNGFYIMKYELSQEQYVSFINSLSRSEQLQLLPQLSTLTKGQYVFGSPHNPDNRNGIIVSVPLSDSRSAVLDNNLTNDDKYGNSDDGRTLACNYMCVSDLLAYTAWSGLRPLAETEYEKTCRRLLPQLPFAQEYAWGTTSLTSMSAIVSETAGWNNETPNNGNTNAEGAFGTFPGNGPVRCGAFSAVATNRSESGSTFSGVMEMSGNLSELCVNASRYSVNNFDGSVHGSGTFSLNDWGTGASSSFGLRGGGFSSEKEELRVSDRSHAESGYFTSLALRDSTVGFRGVRMLNPADIAFNAGNISLSKDGDVICSGEAFTLLGSPAFASGITGLSMHYSWYMDAELLPDETGRDLSFPLGIFNRDNTDKTFSFRREVNCALGTFFASFTLTVPGRLQLSLPEGTGELQLSCNISSVVTASRNKSSSFRWFNGTSGVALTDWSSPSTASRYTPSHTHFGYVGAQRKLRCVSDMGGCKDSVEINLFILPSCSLVLDKSVISMSSNTNGETVTASLCGAGEVSWYYLDDSGRENLLSSTMTSGTPNGASSASSYTITYTPKYADFKNTVGSRTVVVRSKLGDNAACQDRQELTVNVSATLNPGTITAPSPSVVCGNADVLITSSQSAGVDGMSGLTPVYQWFVDGSSTPLLNETASTLKYRLPVNTTNSPVSHTFVRKAFTSSPVLQSGNSNSVTVTVPGVPTVTIGTPVAVCDGQSLALPTPQINWAGLSGTGTWTLNGVAVPSPVRYANNGQILIYTISNSCHASVKSNGMNITVNNRPTVKTLSAPVAVCSGNALPYPAAPAVEWNGLNGSVAWKLNGSVVPNPVLYSHNGQTLTYWATNGCGTTPSNGVAITVNDKPLVGAIATPAKICPGSGLSLSVPVVTNNGLAVTSSGWLLNNVALPSSLTTAHNGQPLKYQAANGCGTGYSNEVTVSVLTPAITNVGTVSSGVSGNALCFGGNFTVSHSGNATTNCGTINSYTWTRTGTSSATFTGQSWSQNGLAAGSYTYSCRVGSSSGASASVSSFTVVVRPLPVGSISGGGSVCSGGTANISLSFSGGSAPYYYTVTGASEANTSSTSISLSKPAGTYYLTALRDANGCVATSRTGSATVSTITPAITSAGSISYSGGRVCTDTRFDISNGSSASASCSAGITYSWYCNDVVENYNNTTNYYTKGDGTYRIKRRATVTSSGSYKESNTITVTVASCGPPPAPGGEKTAILCDGKTWMVQNLNDASKGGQGYEGNIAYCVTDGRLYTWSEAMSACPSGWHLPSDAEYAALNACFDKVAWQPQYAGYWISSGWYSRGYTGDWWTSTGNGSVYDWALGSGDSKLVRNQCGKSSRLSVRCVKN